MLCLVRSKACPRCGGDISVECDIYGVYIQCIQCGAHLSREDLASPTLQKAGKCQKPVRAKIPATSQRR
jgi:hypothetical protein